MRAMSRDEAFEFLTSRTRTGKLATVRGDGRPHIAPVWFVIDSGEIVFTTWHRSVKARNLQRDPRASLLVDLEKPPYAYVLVEGTVTFDDDPDELLRVATNIGGRYMGADRAAEFGRRNGVEGELIVRVAIDKLVANHDIAG